MFSAKHYAYAIYKEKSFSRAARSLYITQPALSATIRRLEEKIGMPLFDRGTTPIRLTACGQRYMEATEAILTIEQDFEAWVSDARNLRTGTLAIGGSNLFTSYVVPPLVAALRKEFPNIRVTLAEDSTERLEAKLLAGELDFIVDNGILDETRFTAWDYQDEHLMVAVPTAFPANEGLEAYRVTPEQIRSGAHLSDATPTLPLERLRDCPFLLLKPHNDTYVRGLALCRDAGFTPAALFELDQQATAYNIAASGMGVCFVSDTLLRRSVPRPELYYYMPDRGTARRMIRFFTRRNAPVTFAMNAWLTLLERPDSSRIP